jgi:hypothetical protein
VLCVAGMAVVMAACQRGSDELFAGPAGHVSPTGDSLEWSVARALSTRHIETSMLETKDAKPGAEFVVLDVSVRNPGTQPQVVSEGSLISVDASRPQTFATPVSMLADEFLTLQVLAPGASVHGKIAFEVPQGLAGVFYWTPGIGAGRILVRVEAAPEPPHTLANAVASQAASRGDRKTEQAATPGDRHSREPGTGTTRALRSPAVGKYAAGRRVATFLPAQLSGLPVAFELARSDDGVVHRDAAAPANAVLRLQQEHFARRLAGL